MYYQGWASKGKVAHALESREFVIALCGQVVSGTSLEWNPKDYISCKHCVNVFNQTERDNVQVSSKRIWVDSDPDINSGSRTNPIDSRNSNVLS